MQQNKKINWWAILAVAVIAIPLGYVGTGVIKKLNEVQDTINNRDTIVPPLPQSDPQPMPEKSFLSIAKKDIRMGSNGGSETFDVNSNVSWKVVHEDGAEWLSVSPSEGRDNGIVTISADNNTGNQRAASLVIEWRNDTGDTMTETINITQDKKIDVTPDDPRPPLTPKQYLNVNTNQVSFTQTGGTKSASIKSNIDWHIQLIGGDGWLEVNTTQGSGSKSVSLTATENQSTEPRSARASISGTDDEGNNITKTINIIQSGKKPLPEPLTKNQIQAIVSKGQQHQRIPDNCQVKVNGMAVNYGKFRKDVSNKVYSSISLEDYDNDDKNNVKALVISATMAEVTKPKALTKEQLQKLINAGKGDEMISPSCSVFVNDGAPQNYGGFLAQCKNYSKISVQKVEYNTSDNKVNNIWVSATTPAPASGTLTDADVKDLVSRGVDDKRISCKITIKDFELDYSEFCRAVSQGTISNVIVLEVKRDSKGKILKIIVSAKERFKEED